MGNRDNFGIFIHLFSIENICCDLHLNHLVETVLMRGHNIFFLEKEEKSSLNYPQYPLLSGALISNVTGFLQIGL